MGTRTAVLRTQRFLQVVSFILANQGLYNNLFTVDDWTQKFELDCMEWMDRSVKESSGTMYDKPTSVIEPGDLLGTIRGLQDPFI